MDSCMKLLMTFSSLPLICLLLSWSCLTATSTTATSHYPHLPPPSSALLAADTLRTRGYSLFASLLLSLSTTNTNFSGTLLAPPDFAFSFVLNKRSSPPPPRPTIPLLLYHTLKPVLTLTSRFLRDHENLQLPTLHGSNCLFLSKNSFQDDVVSISPTPLIKNPGITAVKIRQPDLYVDDHLTVHGVDGVLDLAHATKCSHLDPTADTTRRRHVSRSFLDHSMRALRRKGYSVVSAAMGIRRSEMLTLTSVTVFAVSDESLFMRPDGFRYDFRHHVVPMRHRFADLAAGGTELETLAPNRTVLVNSVDGAVTVDGVAADGGEVYHNRWIVVIAVVKSLDDNGVDNRNSSIGYAPETSPSGYAYSPGTPSPAVKDGGDTRCDMNGLVSMGVEGGDLFCPANNARELMESGVHVDEAAPLEGDSHAAEDLTGPDEKVKIDENVNIADDLFFYT